MAEFKKNDSVLVNALYPGTTEPRLYNGVIEEKIEGADTYKVRIEGSLTMIIGVANIRAA